MVGQKQYIFPLEIPLCGAKNYINGVGRRLKALRNEQNRFDCKTQENCQSGPKRAVGENI